MHDDSTHKEKISLKSPLFCGALRKNFYDMYVSLCRYNFVVKVIDNGHMKVKNSLVWKYGNRVFQEDICKLWLALLPIFIVAYSEIRIPEQNKMIAIICCIDCDCVLPVSTNVLCFLWVRCCKKIENHWSNAHSMRDHVDQA